ncbi:MAG TPA: hypothetical protein VFR57_03065 [Burkholderiales bacterium]|nr:hypothetical protein [Burkholderiales bacterium]
MLRTLLMVAMLALAACSVDYGQTRSSFQLKVAGKSLEEAVDAAGKPTREENRGPDEKVLVYEKKTFDSENQNAKDAAVRVFFKKDASGKFQYSSIEFVPET